MACALMLQGTGSDVGKTVLVAGLCRLARRRGLRVVPFKPQNMSNNAAVALEGGEIGRGQWLQAFAAGQVPSVHMNPVLLKPQSESGAQVVVRGQHVATVEARGYQQLKRDLLVSVLDSFNHLKKTADLILVEGAGASAEINLRANDIANMGFARETDVPVMLVGDIDRGGVIAALVGSHAVLPPEDRALIAGFIINKFRGDVRLFDDGVKAISSFTGWRCFGVVPWLDSFARLPAEDSLGLKKFAALTKNGSSGQRVKIAVPVTSGIANFDDLDPLQEEEDVELVLLRAGDMLPQDADIVLLPGTKSTITSMAEIVNNGWADAIRAHAAKGGTVIGLCGGLQMLGDRIIDREGREGQQTEIAGLGLLQLETVMGEQKILRNVSGFDRRFGETVSGYEIHLGLSEGEDCARAPIVIDGKPNGAADATGKIWGTYLHGLFASGAWRAKYLATCGVRSLHQNHEAIIDAALDEIATTLETALDCETLFATAR